MMAVNYSQFYQSMDRNFPGSVCPRTLVQYSGVTFVSGLLLPPSLAFCTGVLVGKDWWLPTVSSSVR